MHGRARLRVSDRRGDGAFFASVATGLSSLPGVYKVDVRPLTGSILIQHGAPLERIGAAAQEARLFTVENGPPISPAAPAVTIDPKTALAVGFGVFAFWQLTQGRVLPPAVTLLWYAARLTGLTSDGDSADDGE